MHRANETFGCQLNAQRHVCPRSWCGFLQFLTMVIAWALFTATGLLAQQAKPSEYQVKAAYLYNFGRFVKWPAGVAAGKGDSFPVCVLGRDPFGPILDSTLAGEALEGKPVAIRRIAREQDAADCRILFVSSTEEHHSISRKLTGMNMLVSGAALLLACAAFIAFDMITFRQAMLRNLSTQAQIIGSNSVSALLFNDPQSAENTLLALKAAPNILSAQVYLPDGRPFASYSRDRDRPGPLLPPISPRQTETHWIENDQIALVRSIVLDGKPIGAVYIRSDLQELHSRFQRYAAIAAIVLSACLLAALLISSIFRRAVADPIVDLSKIARVVSQDKNYSVRATPIRSPAELAILIDAFNEMLAQIQRSEKALLMARDELEQRVRERTAELETAKREVEEFSRSVLLAKE